VNQKFTERDLRSRVRGWWGKAVFWVEAGRGGTVGMPDAVVVRPAGTMFVELKAGHVNDGRWRVDLRPSQMQVCRRLVKQGADVRIFVIDKRDGGVWWTDFETVIAAGGNKKIVPVFEAKHSEMTKSDR